MAESMDARLAAAGLPALPRRLWAEIDESALAANLLAVRGLLAPGADLNAVVKADAYGHGLVPVGRVFEAAGADRLCVASIDEATALRAGGVQLPILIMFPIPASEVVRAANSRFEIVASEDGTTAATLERWTAARPDGVELAIHVEVETGLTRGGFKPEAVVAIARRILATPGVRLAALWSHLARSDDAAASAAQLAAFERATAAVREAGIEVPPRHLAATGGLFAGRVPSYEGVRIGLGLYGLLPADLPVAPEARGAADDLRPALALKCRPLRVESFPIGTPVSYGGLWVSARESRIATLPIGYGDGWPRSSSPLAGALVRGVRVPLVGSVTMDAVMADVTDVPGVGLDDEFVLIGEQDGARIVTNELARLRTTIPYEVVTTMAHRLPRVYHAGSVPMGIRTLNGETRTRQDDGSDRGAHNAD